jgi:sugar O-acyltransferase (sialic acid O-acetyltransferase NeuD family)
MDVVIFGVGLASRLAAYVLAHDSAHRPVALTVNERFIAETEYAGLPVRRFEDLERVYPPERVALIAPLGWTRMGGLRADVLAAGKAKGYRFINYVSSRAITWPTFAAGENSMIFDGVIVEPYARVGRNCIIRAGAVLSHDVELGEHCFVAPRASISGAVRVGTNCVIGAGSVISEGLRIAPRCFIAAGAVVTADTQADGIYRGNPARRSPVTVDRFGKLGK